MTTIWRVYEAVLILATRTERYPQEARTQAQSDGQATSEVTNREAGILVGFTGVQNTTARIEAGTEARTETKVQAASTGQVSDDGCKQVGVRSDARFKCNSVRTSCKTRPDPHRKLQQPGEQFWSRFQPAVESEEMGGVHLY